MKMNVAKEVAALERMTVGQLQERYTEVFGESVRSRHRQYLMRRIAWRLQANAEGGLSERALRRAEELADLADARVTPPRGAKPAPIAAGYAVAQVVKSNPDPRLPEPGTALCRKYKGQTVNVTVLPDGFEFASERYRSLSAVAKAVTGSHMNGFRFFGLEEKS